MSFLELLISLLIVLLGVITFAIFVIIVTAGEWEIRTQIIVVNLHRGENE